jgi:hypothetical protein
VLAPRDGDIPPEAPDAPARRSPYQRLLVGVGVALIAWLLVPAVPHDQTLIFALGAGAPKLAQLEVSWETGAGHQGGFTLNFDAEPPARVVRQLRLANGQYAFHVSARRRDVPGERTEVSRRVTLDGSTQTLRLEELTE